MSRAASDNPPRLSLFDGSSNLENNNPIWQKDTDTAVTVPTAPSLKTALPTPRRMVDSQLSLDTIFCGDNLSLIQKMASDSVQLVITSPPYFQQRDYGTAGMGNEGTLAQYLQQLIALFAECVRVTADDGSIVFNLGDKYEDSSLLLVPYRFAIAVTEQFPVRLVNNVTWVKQNPTPRQFRRRLVSSTEPFFHFVKSPHYYYDIDAFLDERGSRPKKTTSGAKLGQKYVALLAESSLSPAEKQKARADLYEVIEETRIGKIAGFRMKIRGIHSEAFGGQEGGRKTQMDKQGFTIIRLLGQKMKRDVIETPVETVKGCKHPAIYPVEIVEEFLHLLTYDDALVLDPFMGSGSTAVACKRHNRRFIGFDVNPEYCDYARERIAATEPIKRVTP